MITDSEDRSMIAELEQIIQAEEAKPEAERDADLIDECIREIAELKGVKADFSDEEIDRITEKLVKAAEQEKKRKRFIRLAAGIAAVFVIVSGVTACAINPALINWFAKVVRMPFGTTVEQSRITYINHGTTHEYNSIDDFIRSEKYDILYPSILPPQTSIDHIEVLNKGNIIGFFFTNESIYFTVQFSYDLHTQLGDVISEVDSNGIHFDVYFNGTEYIAISEINEIRYTIQTKEISNIILIAAGLRKA